MIRTVNEGVEAVAPMADRYEPPAGLSPDQRKALVHVLTSSDRVTGFRGLAGSGKSGSFGDCVQRVRWHAPVHLSPFSWLLALRFLLCRCPPKLLPQVP